MVERTKEREITRVKLEIKGIVQGVGFRPFIYKLAKEHDLNGWVLNTTEGVTIEVEGSGRTIKTFIEHIPQKAPPLAKIDSISVHQLSPVGYSNFTIRQSEGDKSRYMKISPDISICSDCLRELFDINDRRYRYPFINCTNCGPRFTIVKDIPYDRENTTMSAFKMCSLCQAEYDDPLNRRFHAQPNACHSCGPSVYLEGANGKIECDDAISHCIELLSKGYIVAVKGIGGFHLACDATNDEAVLKLRARKRRTLKPFAIMSRDVDSVRQYCLVDSFEEQLLTSVQRPIVLLQKLENCPISEYVAPNNKYLGVMLPYTPLHYLLFDSPILALVMTSGNISEEPIAYENQEARFRLSNLADFFLLHNRDIRSRCDDSVVRAYKGELFLIRRARGYAPYPIDLKFSLRQVLACGAELKNTFCLTKDNHAFISHHIGDLQNFEAYKYYKESIEHYKKLFRIEPEVVAYDLHPEYLSTRYALEQDKPSVGVQHHHAHIVSCMAENGLDGKVIGVACDGTGYGTDGNIWGCEFLVADYHAFQRYAHLEYVPLPGGDTATKEPYRMALSYLYHVFGEEMLNLDIPLLKRIDKKKVDIIMKMIGNRVNSPYTSSSGRLFDAVSSIIGIRDIITYEAQAAIELEMIAQPDIYDKYSFTLQELCPSNGDGELSGSVRLCVSVRDMIAEIVEEIIRGVPQSVISAKFHNTFAEIISTLCEKIGKETMIDRVVMSGGTFQNVFLLNRILEILKKKNFKVYIHKQVPSNDGGISLGQAVIGSRAPIV